MNPLLNGKNAYEIIHDDVVVDASESSSVSDDSDNQNHGDSDKHMTKTYGLFDLLCVGVGATVGSGVFVLTGLVARDIAGPGVVFSWIIAGLACCLSATSFAELSSRFPTSTSSYTFVKYALGDWLAYLAAWSLSLECGLSAAAVARSWGRKLISLTSSSSSSMHAGSLVINPSNDEWGFNVYACLLQMAAVGLFLAGKDVSKLVINIFTVAKVLLIMFMILMGLYLFDVQNFQPTVTPMGWDGVLRGATLCFFGFVGYDEVCCLALETKHAQRLMPQAVFGTIVLVCILYGLSSIALVGMENYQDIDRENGYAHAFHAAGYPTAGMITAVGEMVMLPLVVLLSFLPQPRILAAMARDQLAPTWLATTTVQGNLVNAILVSGFITIVVAAFVPFIVLNDLISAGVLLSFNFTNTALILIRCDRPDDVVNFRVCSSNNQSNHSNNNNDDNSWYKSCMSWLKIRPLSQCQCLLLLYHGITIVFAVQIAVYSFNNHDAHDRHTNNSNSNTSMLFITLFCLASVIVLLYRVCPDHDGHSLHLNNNTSDKHNRSNNNSNNSSSNNITRPTKGVYRTAGVPFVPLMGIFINTILIFQLSTNGLWIFVGYFTFASILYVIQRCFTQNASSSPSKNNHNVLHHTSSMRKEDKSEEDDGEEEKQEGRSKIQVYNAIEIVPLHAHHHSKK